MAAILKFPTKKGRIAACRAFTVSSRFRSRVFRRTSSATGVSLRSRPRQREATSAPVTRSLASGSGSAARTLMPRRFAVAADSGGTLAAPSGGRRVRCLPGDWRVRRLRWRTARGAAHRASLEVPGSDRAVNAQCPRRLLGVRHRRLGEEDPGLRRLLAGDRAGDLVACTLGPARGAPP